MQYAIYMFIVLYLPHALLSDIESTRVPVFQNCFALIDLQTADGQDS